MCILFVFFLHRNQKTPGHTHIYKILSQCFVVRLLFSRHGHVYSNGTSMCSQFATHSTAVFICFIGMRLPHVVCKHTRNFVCSALNFFFFFLYLLMVLVVDVPFILFISIYYSLSYHTNTHQHTDNRNEFLLLLLLLPLLCVYSIFCVVFLCSNFFSTCFQSVDDFSTLCIVKYVKARYYIFIFISSLLLVLFYFFL